MMSVDTDIMFCLYFYYKQKRGSYDDFKHFMLICHYEFLSSYIS